MRYPKMDFTMSSDFWPLRNEGRREYRPVGGLYRYVANHEWDKVANFVSDSGKPLDGMPPKLETSFWHSQIISRCFMFGITLIIRMMSHGSRKPAGPY